MPINIYLRRFNKKGVEKKTTDEIKISKYFPTPMKESFKKLLNNKLINKENYIICPLYTQGDVQFGITGTTKRGESSTVAIARECGEEVGLVPDNLSSLNPLKKFTKENITFNTFYIDISNTTKVLDHQQVVINRNKDTRDKVGCILHGSKYLSLKFLETNIYRYKSEDDISGVCAIKFMDIINSI